MGNLVHNHNCSFHPLSILILDSLFAYIENIKCASGVTTNHIPTRDCFNQDNHQEFLCQNEQCSRTSKRNLKISFHSIKIQIDDELNKVPMAVDLEQKIGVPKALVVCGVSAVVGILIFFNIMGNLLTNIIGFVYPAYASFKANCANIRRLRVPTRMTMFNG